MKSPENKPPRGMTLEATFGDGKHATPASLGANRNGDQESSGLSDYLAWPGRLCLLIAVVLAPWPFASVNFRPQSWIAISLLAGLGFWWFESSMNARRRQVLPLLFFPLALGIALGLFQLLPLPEAMSGLLGRQVEIQQQLTGPAGGASVAENVSISVNHDGTWHHLRLLTIALAAMLLGSRYFRTKQDIVLLLTTMTISGVVISFYGIIFSLTSNGKMFWFHEVTLGGQPFGPFVNRNNACCYLLVCLAAATGLLPILLADRKRSGPRTIVSREIPLLQQFTTAVLEFVAELDAKKVAALLAIVLIGTGVIVSLSRGGTLAMLFGGVVSVFAYGMARQPKKNSLFIFIPALLLAGLLVGFWTLGGELTDRFLMVDTVEIETDLRVNQWQSTWPASKEFGLLGSGLGSYRGVHRAYRTIPEIVVFHYAENQYFQGLIEAGWVGVSIYLVAWLLVFGSASLLLSRGQSPTSVGVGLMGMYLISSQAFASSLDFGFYIPANLLALAVMFGFLSYHAQALGGRLKKASWLRLRVPSVAISTIVLILFGLTCLVAYSLHQRASIDGLCHPRVALMTRDNMSLKKSTARLDQLLPAVKNTPTPKGLNYAAGLLIHRCRLQLFEAILSELDTAKIVAAAGSAEEKAEARKRVDDNIWNSTQLMQLQENANFLKSESRIELSRFKSQPGIQENLPLAIQLLEYSREISPLQPFVHLRLAQLNSIIGHTREADRSIERTLEIAPMNPTFRKIAGLYYFQSNRPELAAEQFRDLLELQPRQFGKIMAIVTGRSNRSIEPMSTDLISHTMLPDDPKMLFDYASKYQILNAEDKKSTLERAASILDALDYRENEQNQMLGNIRSLQGQKEKAIEAYSDFLLIVPHHESYRYKRAQLLEQLGKYELALEDADRLADRAIKPEKYRKFARELRNKIAEQEEKKP